MHFCHSSHLCVSSGDDYCGNKKYSWAVHLEPGLNDEEKGMIQAPRDLCRTNASSMLWE